MAKKASLKSVLISQQERLKKKAKAKEASEKAQKQITSKGKPNKGKAREVGNSTSNSTSRLHENDQNQTIIPFKETDRILLVGEGDFSFTRALLTHPTLLNVILPKNVTASAYDSEEECFSKYSGAKGIVQDLRERGTEILFGVDATALEKCKILRKRKWDRIVWNFPHAGAFNIYLKRLHQTGKLQANAFSLGKGITDQSRNILSNQTLLLGFLRSAAPLLATGSIPKLNGFSKKKRRNLDNDEDDEIENNGDNNDRMLTSDDDDKGFDQIASDDRAQARGTILITLRNVTPYTEWYVLYLL